MRITLNKTSLGNYGLIVFSFFERTRISVKPSILAQGVTKTTLHEQCWQHVTRWHETVNVLSTNEPGQPIFAQLYLSVKIVRQLKTAIKKFPGQGNIRDLCKYWGMVP